MALPPPTRRSSSLPALGLLLAGLGLLVLLESAMGDAVERPAGSHGVTLAAPSHETGSRAWGDAWSGSGDALRSAQNRLRGRVRCLGADLATGRRAESMHLATVPVQRPADCGDLRDALAAIAALPHVDGDKNPNSAPRAVTAVPPQADGEAVVRRHPGLRVRDLDLGTGFGTGGVLRKAFVVEGI
jgi:hypothetical protein